MPVEVLSAIIAVFGTIASALIAMAVSRSTAKKEIEKMKLGWKREDEKAEQDEFADMVKAVNKFIAFPNDSCRLDAVEKVSVLQAKGGNIDLLSCFLKCLTSDYEKFPIEETLESVREFLSIIIDKNSEQESPQK